MSGRSRRSSPVLLLVLGAILSTTAAPAAEIFPLSEVRPGMKGVGRTVFEAGKLEEFQVTIIGVLENIGPKQSMILARLEGGPLANTGVIAGMSGSPVYIDGKLLGAVAYGFPFSKETIGGITPIGEMIESTRVDTPRAAVTRFLPGRPRGALALRFPLDRRSLIASLQRPPLPMIVPSGPAAAALPSRLSGLPLTPLPMPMVFSGMDPQAFDWARGIFSGLGFAPVAGSAKGAAVAELPAPAFVPGGALGLSLIEGDMDVSVTGTITEVLGDRVYAFGHPFYNLGPTQLPMRSAYVYSVFPSLYESWKISMPVGPVVGTIEQDRAAAVAGHLGKAPRMIPITVKIATARGPERQFSFRMVDDELFSPLLAYVSLLSVLQASERALGTSTIGVQGEVTLDDERSVQVEDIFVDEQPAQQASALLAAPLAYLMSNDFESVKVSKLDVSVTSYETNQSALLERAWVERTGPIRAGSEVAVNLLFRSYRGDALSETVPMTIPTNARPGNYTLLLADATTVTTLDQQEMKQVFNPKDLDQLVRAINGLRRSNHVYLRLLQAQAGAIVAGEYLPALPPSVLSVMGAAQGSEGVVPLHTAAIWEHDLHTDYAISGTKSLTLTIER
jgi:SpoIVB peptidase S55